MDEPKTNNNNKKGTKDSLKYSRAFVPLTLLTLVCVSTLGILSITTSTLWKGKSELASIEHVNTPTMITMFTLAAAENGEKVEVGADGSVTAREFKTKEYSDIYSDITDNDKWTDVGTDADTVVIGGATFYTKIPYAWESGTFFTNSVKADKMYWDVIKGLNLPTTKSEGYAVSKRPFCYEYSSRTSNTVVDGVKCIKCAIAPSCVLRDWYEGDKYRGNGSAPDKNTWPKKVVAVCEGNGNELYLPLIFADAKAHWYPFGFQQTQVANKGGMLYGANPDDFSGPSGAPDLGEHFAAAYNWSSTHSWKNNGTPCTADCYGAVIEPYGGADINCNTLCSTVKVKGFITIQAGSSGNTSNGNNSSNSGGGGGGRPSWVVGLHGVDQAGANTAYDYLKAKGIDDGYIQSNWDALMNHYAGHGTSGW